MFISIPRVRTAGCASPRSPTDLAHIFRTALDVLGPKRLLFGTDSSWFPRGWVRDVFDDQIKASGRGGRRYEETARAVLGGNLRRLFQKQRSGNS